MTMLGLGLQKDSALYVPLCPSMYPCVPLSVLAIPGWVQLLPWPCTVRPPPIPGGPSLPSPPLSSEGVNSAWSPGWPLRRAALGCSLPRIPAGPHPASAAPLTLFLARPCHRGSLRATHRVATRVAQQKGLWRKEGGQGHDLPSPTPACCDVPSRSWAHRPGPSRWGWLKGPGQVWAPPCSRSISATGLRLHSQLGMSDRWFHLSLEVVGPCGVEEARGEQRGGRESGEEGALGLLAVPCGADPGACLGEAMGTFPQGRKGRAGSHPRAGWPDPCPGPSAPGLRPEAPTD